MRICKATTSAGLACKKKKRKEKKEEAQMLVVLNREITISNNGDLES
jgi:hypothetical protein